MALDRIFSSCSVSYSTMHTTKNAHKPGFVTGGSFLAQKKVAKLFIVSWRSKLVTPQQLRKKKKTPPPPEESVAYGPLPFQPFIFERTSRTQRWNHIQKKAPDPLKL